jgi:hypothetical protein
MVNNIPEAEDFYESGKGLLDFAWNTVAILLTNLDNAKYYGVDEEEVSETYWNASKRSLTTALAITQQGVEFVLKGKIAEISPFLLISDPPQRWPSPYDCKDIDFAQFRTIDAQDLVRVHDTFSASRLDPNFVDKFNSLREKRNAIMHSVDKKLSVHVTEVFEAILSMHKALFPDKGWGKVRRSFLEISPDSELGGIDFVTNMLCWEFYLVFSLLTPAKVKEFFKVDKKQRSYFCPKCYEDRDSHVDFEYKLAVLDPKGPKSTKLYCPVCDEHYDVIRQQCDEDDCPGNVISEEYGFCLNCGG